MISAWLSQHGHVLLFTIKQLLLKPVANLCSIWVIGIALSLPAGLYLVIDNLQSLSGQAAGTPQMSLFIKTDTAWESIVEIKQRLEADSKIIDFQFIPKDVALQQLQHSNGLTDIAVNLGKNPLPDAFVVHLQETTPEALQQLHATMQNWPEIEFVQFDSDWIERLNAILDLGRSVVLMLSILLSAAIIAIMFNTIRLQILTKREEIEISKLIGATDSFIQRPFLYFGAIQGLAGGIVAWLIIAIVIDTMNHQLIELATLYDTDLQLQFLSSADSISLLIFSSWLGWLGARISVASHLWQIESK
ncbi:MAG: permease-like cell division protein FtsX [Nitrosomonas sp.]|nr:MAG: permease-like cell division protein FtsX [Nitrosomonas sp.]